MTLTAHTIPGYQTGTWKIDPTHSEVTFSVRHLAISKVKGKFETFDATLVTAENPLESTVEANIDVASINTGQEQRDQHLKTERLLPHRRAPAADLPFDGHRGEGRRPAHRRRPDPARRHQAGRPQGRARRLHHRRLRPGQVRRRGDHEDRPHRVRCELERGARGRRLHARQRRHDQPRRPVRPPGGLSHL